MKIQIESEVKQAGVNGVRLCEIKVSPGNVVLAESRATETRYRQP